MGMEKAVISVAHYVDILNQTLRTASIEGFLVEGEVSDFRISQGKWVNFDLKDENAECKVSCFMTVYQLGVPLQDGLKVQVAGYPKIFERFGKFSLNITHVELVGQGALQQAYLLMKKKLADEGLFDAARKRSIPRFPHRIGLITSKEAAAYGDFLRILGNRWCGVEVLHAPVHVQGQYAVPEILSAFETFNAMSEEDRPDVLVLTRGGGSLEDLHAFNDERVARAVFSSVIPVVVGVGHERDESLCDFVADVRASTPSNAAELIVPDRREFERYLETAADRMQGRLLHEVERKQDAINRSVHFLERFVTERVHEVRNSIEQFRHAFDRFRLSVIATIEHINRRRTTVVQLYEYWLRHMQHALDAKERFLNAVDPVRVLKRGYAIVRSNGKVVRDPKQLAPGDRLAIQLASGVVEAAVDKRGAQEQLL